MTIQIIGAGMAGLLAGAMLRNECDRIIEASPQLPNNHHAVLRFRSHIVGDVLNIPFKQVNVVRTVQPSGNAVRAAMLYSQKCTGMARVDRSILNADGRPVERFIAPPDLIQRMAAISQKKITYNLPVKPSDIQINRAPHEAIISTIPMPQMMIMSGWIEKHGRQDFGSVPGVTITAELQGVEAYCSVYVPNDELRYSRISITGNIMHIEFPMPGINPAETDLVGELDSSEFYTTESEIESAMWYLGLNPDDHLVSYQKNEQRYAKILPIDEQVRKRFMLWLTETYNVYSLGRFATWRPGLLLDDVVNDVRVIHRLIHGGSAYDHKKG